MAIQLSYTVQTGVSGNHWELIMTNVDRRMSIISCLVYLFVNSSAALNKERPIYGRTHVFIGTEYASVLGQIIGPPEKTADDIIEQHLIDNYSEWSGATRVANSWPG